MSLLVYNKHPYIVSVNHIRIPYPYTAPVNRILDTGKEAKIYNMQELKLKFYDFIKSYMNLRPYAMP